MQKAARLISGVDENTEGEGGQLLKNMLIAERVLHCRTTFVDADSKTRSAITF